MDKHIGVLRELDQGGTTLDSGEFWRYRSIVSIEDYGVTDKVEIKIKDPKGNLLVSLVMEQTDMGELFTRHRAAGTLWVREFPLGLEEDAYNRVYNIGVRDEDIRVRRKKKGR